MMIQVVRSGTGTAAAIPGVQVAGKTGTAELRPNSTNPKDSDAWFVAFAPAQHPTVAVAVMLVGAGSAAPPPLRSPGTSCRPPSSQLTLPPTDIRDRPTMAMHPGIRYTPSDLQRLPTR